MAGKRQVVVPGGIRKVIQTGGPTASPGTTIAELGATTVSLAQLKVLLGITAPAAGSSGSGGGSTASILAGAGLLGGGSVIGAVPLYLAQSTPPVVWNDALLPDDFVGGAASGGGGSGGSSTLAGLSDVAISSPTAGQFLEYNGTKWANQTGGGGGFGQTVGGLQVIQEQAVSAGTTVTFTNIPQGFRDLVLVVNGATTATSGTAVNMSLTINGDTGTNYDQTHIFNGTSSGGGSVTNVAPSGQTLWALAPSVSGMSTLHMELYDYAQTTLAKNIFTFNTRKDSGSAFYVQSGTLYWTGTAAITSLTLTLASNAFAAGTVVTLYGRGGSGVSGAAVILGNVSPDLHPSNPDPINDEFEGSVFDPKWTLLNTGTTAVSKGSAVLTSTFGSVDHIYVAEQSISGTFTIRAKLQMSTGNSHDGRCGVYVGLGGTSGKAYAFGLYASGLDYYVNRYTGVNTFTSTFIGISSLQSLLGVTGSWLYMEVQYDGTNVIFRLSLSGVDGTFIQIGSEAASSFLGSAPVAVGVFADSNGTFGPGVFDWFRRMDTSGTTPQALFVPPGNVNPDTHPSLPTAWDDEFEAGTAIDTTGARFAGANAWTGFTANTIASVVGQGALLSVTQGTSTSAGAGYAQPVPSGNWTFVWKGLRPAFEVFNLSSWKGYYFGTSGSGNNMLVQHETRNWSTGAYTFGGSDASFSTNGEPAYFMLSWNGTNLVFSWSQTGYSVDFTTLVTVAASTFIITPDHIGFGTSAAEAVDWFRRTA